MTTPVKDLFVDTRGHRCPVPTLRLRRQVERTFEGARIRLLADDPLARIDVPHYVAQAGLEMIEMHDEGEVISFLIRKPYP